MSTAPLPAEDRLAVADVIASMLHAVDRLDWLAVRAALADSLALDYTSLFGGEPETITAEELVVRWAGLLPGFDATQHLIGPVVTTGAGDEALSTCQVRGHHVVDDDARAVWMVAGEYGIAARRSPDGWRIAGITLRVHDEEGDRALTGVATNRVAQGWTRP